MTQPPDPDPETRPEERPGAYPPPGFGYPPPGYPPPGYPPPGYPLPPAQPRPRNNKLLIGIGSGVLVVVLLCVGCGFLALRRLATNVEHATANRRPDVSVPGPLATLQAQQLHAVNSSGTPLALGATLTVQDGLGNKARLTISRTRFQKKACSSLSEVPTGMGLLIADLTIQVDAGSLRPTEFDFALDVHGQGAINGFEGMMSGCGTSLSMATQRAGTTQHANLVFITQVWQGEIVYTPLPSMSPVGSWTLV